jgi:hypothetical protein
MMPSHWILFPSVLGNNFKSRFGDGFHCKKLHLCVCVEVGGGREWCTQYTKIRMSDVFIWNNFRKPEMEISLGRPRHE